MRLIPLLLIALLIAGCAPAPTPTPEPTAVPTETPTPEPTAANISGEFILGDQVFTVPPAGVIVRPDTAMTPTSPRQPLVLVDLEYRETGGLNQTTTVIRLDADGVFTRSDIRGERSGQPDPEAVEAVRAAMDALDILTLGGTFTGPGLSSDGFRYTLTITANEGSTKTIDTQDGLTPVELLELFALVKQIDTID